MRRTTGGVVAIKHMLCLWHSWPCNIILSSIVLPWQPSTRVPQYMVLRKHDCSFLLTGIIWFPRKRKTFWSIFYVTSLFALYFTIQTTGQLNWGVTSVSEEYKRTRLNNMLWACLVVCDKREKSEKPIIVPGPLVQAASAPTTELWLPGDLTIHTAWEHDKNTIQWLLACSSPPHKQPVFRTEATPCEQYPLQMSYILYQESSDVYCC